MDPVPAQRPDHQVSVYIGQLRRRHELFRREHTAEMKHMSHDFLSRLFSEHIVFGERETFEAQLQGMLSDEERDRLPSDPEFTQAWRIFVDLVWTRKQITRAALVLGGIIVVMLIVLGFFLAMPYVAKGPVQR